MFKTRKSLIVGLLLAGIIALAFTALSLTGCDNGTTPTTDPYKDGHTYTVSQGVTAPTCTTGGYETFKCTTCTATEQQNQTAASGHTWPDGDCTADGGCTKCDEPAKATHARAFACSLCTVCGTASSTGHTSNNAQATNCLAPNTCTVCSTVIDTAKATHARAFACSTCTDCGTASSTAHTWSNWTITTHPTEFLPTLAEATTTNGKETKTCTVCTTPETRTLTVAEFQKYFYGTWTRTYSTGTETTVITALRHELTDTDEDYVKFNITSWTPRINDDTETKDEYPIGFSLTYTTVDQKGYSWSGVGFSLSKDGSKIIRHLTNIRILDKVEE